MTDQFTLANALTTDDVLAAMKRISIERDYISARYTINAYYQPQRDRLDALHRAALNALDARYSHLKG